MVVWVRGGRWDGGANRAKQVQGEKEKVGRAESSFRDARGACLACQMVPKRTKSAFVGSRRRRWPERHAAAWRARAIFVEPKTASLVREHRDCIGFAALPMASLDFPRLEFAESRKVQPLASISTCHPVTTALDLAFDTRINPRSGCYAQTCTRSHLYTFRSVDRITVARFAASETTLLLASAHPPIYVHTLIATSTLGDSITA